MHRCEYNSLVFYQFETLAIHPVLEHGVFTRLGGVSTGPYHALNVGSTVGDDADHVTENRRRLAESMGVTDADTRTVWQVHGADVLAVDGQTPQSLPPPQADGIVTNTRGVPLVMRFADCVPVLLYDPKHEAAGIAHAGWKGTLLGVGTATLRAMAEQYGTQPADVIAAIGPSIGPCCYEVGKEVVQGVLDVFGSTDGLVLQPVNGGRPHLDLWEANKRTLKEAGVMQVETAQMCTSCNTHEFFSHRKEKGDTGRFGVLLTLRGA